ncbi:MAG: hypothetical protein ABL931_00175 [Usitatibacteraceae bacterium]
MTKQTIANDNTVKRRIKKDPRPEPSEDREQVSSAKIEAVRPARRRTPSTKQLLNRWLKVRAENPLAKQLGLARFKLGDLGSRGGVGLRALYLCGPQGVGKTHSIVEQETVWRANGLYPIRCRPRDVRELLDQFKAARGLGPLIMEEADIIFRSKPMFEVLKQATDPKTPDVIWRIEKTKEGKENVPINLNVPIVVSTNMDLWDPKFWDAKLLNDRDALFERSAPVTLARDPFMLWEWSVYLALTSHLTRDVLVRNPKGGKPTLMANPLSIQHSAIRWFTENVASLVSISPRTLKKIAEILGRQHRDDMPEEIAQAELAGLIAKRREMEQPSQSDWSELLLKMPKTTSTARKVSTGEVG